MSKEPQDHISMWNYAVKTVREAWATKGKTEAERGMNNHKMETCVDQEMKQFAENLEQFAGDVDHSERLMLQAAGIIRAIFDPENQPSQFGTELMKPVTPRESVAANIKRNFMESTGPGPYYGPSDVGG